MPRPVPFLWQAIRGVMPMVLVAAIVACAAPGASRPSGAGPAPGSAFPGERTAADAARFDRVLEGTWRTPAFRERDAYRHPRDTLRVLGVHADQRVIEITPGAGWYSEILAPFLHMRGRYVAAIASAAPDSAGGRRNAALRAKFAADPAHYGRVEVLEFDPSAPRFGAAGSADVVLTFRNAHNWVDAGTADAYFRGFHDVLKRGGVLGVVDHRARPGTDLETMKRSGYLTEQLVIDLATRAGFRLDARSEVNANPRDSADHPNGVWTLPPTNRHEPADAERYRAVGESDRMTLRFIKD